MEKKNNDEQTIVCYENEYEYNKIRYIKERQDKTRMCVMNDLKVVSTYKQFFVYEITPVPNLIMIRVYA